MVETSNTKAADKPFQDLADTSAVRVAAIDKWIQGAQTRQRRRRYPTGTTHQYRIEVYIQIHAK